MNSDCKVRLYYFEIYYNLILDIANILDYDNEKDLINVVIDLVNEINDYCAKEFTFYDYLPPNIKINREIHDKEININRLQNKLRTINSDFFKILAEPTEPTKLKRLQNLAIEILKLAKIIKENKISPDG